MTMTSQEAWMEMNEQLDLDQLILAQNYAELRYEQGKREALTDTLGLLEALAKRLDTPIELPLKGLRFDIWNGEFIVRQEQEPEILIRAEVEALLKGDVADADA